MPSYRPDRSMRRSFVDRSTFSWTQLTLPSCSFMVRSLSFASLCRYRRSMSSFDIRIAAARVRRSMRCPDRSPFDHVRRSQVPGTQRAALRACRTFPSSFLLTARSLFLGCRSDAQLTDVQVFVGWSTQLTFRRIAARSAALPLIVGLPRSDPVDPAFVDSFII